jgi:hypothetical protein
MVAAKTARLKLAMRIALTPVVFQFIDPVPAYSNYGLTRPKISERAS